jgi:hypothetical protein
MLSGGRVIRRRGAHYCVGEVGGDVGLLPRGENNVEALATSIAVGAIAVTCL